MNEMIKNLIGLEVLTLPHQIKKEKEKDRRAKEREAQVQREYEMQKQIMEGLWNW